MTDSMSEDYNKEQDSQLAKAIEECKKVAASSSKEAKENVAFIKDSIEKANKEIVSCIKDISKQKIRDEEILTSLKKQLTKIKTTFVSEYDEVEQLVDKNQGSKQVQHHLIWQNKSRQEYLDGNPYQW